MRIIIDAMSGDNAPDEIIRGAAAASAEYTATYILVGDKTRILASAEKYGLDLKNFEIVHTDDVITMEDDPLSIVRSKARSSMGLGLKLLADGEGDAFVSAGNTGALFTGATLIVRKIKGIRRAAIANIMPMKVPVLLVDAGANLNVTDEYIEQFAVMGSIYMKNIYGVENPRVGLLNNGSEACKGTQLQLDSYARLSESSVNFVGNIEANKLPFDVCDVLVTDGFTGNIVLKYTEGLGKLLLDYLKEGFMHSVFTKVSAAIMKDQLKSMKKKFDPSEYGGAPLLGISKPVIKAHGSSDAKAIKNAVRQAISYVNTGIIYEIARDTEQYRNADENAVTAAAATAGAAKRPAQSEQHEEKRPDAESDQNAAGGNGENVIAVNSREVTK